MAKPPDPIFTLRGQMKWVHSLYCHDKDSPIRVYCGTSSGQVHVWNIESFRELTQITVGTQPCIAIVFNGNFVTQEKNGFIKIWEESNLQWQLIFSFETNHTAFCKMSLFQDVIVCPNFEHSIKLYNISQPEDSVLIEHDKNCGIIMCLKFLMKENEVLAAFEDGTLKVLAMDGGLKSKCKFNSECPMAVDVCERTSYGILGTSGDELIKFKIEGSISKVTSMTLKNPGVSSIAVREDGVLFAAGVWNGVIKYFSMKSLKLLAVLSHHSLSVECLQFGAFPEKVSSKNVLYAGSRDGRVSIWDLY